MSEANLVTKPKAELSNLFASLSEGNQAVFAADKRSRDTASYARVYQAVMTADKRRRSRSVETRAGFPPVDKAECSARTWILTYVRS
ncbi:hypothetical protein DMI82_11420 [Blautia sp. BCRC 81119]|nr:hypothetical protein DMI82_11420 [Blautia sp. BCRC 81119]